jgi:hypothetical protein
MSAKPTYSIDVPDQARLKLARLEIEAVLKKHDLAGIVLLHTPGMTEFFYDIRPSYSCCWIDQDAQLLRLKSKQADYGGDLVRMTHDRVATANMTAGFAEDLTEVAQMFAGIDSIVRAACDATHTPREFVRDQSEGRPQ